LSLSFVYYGFRDAVSGMSPGKRLVGLRVAEIEEGDFSFGLSFMRNILLSAPYILIIAVFMSRILGIVPQEQGIALHGFLSVLFFVCLLAEYIAATGTKSGLRIGDRLAGTHLVDLYPERAGWKFAVLGAFLFIVNAVLSKLIGI
jgi:uncharacterized RDD family membrane protein YckC